MKALCLFLLALSLSAESLVIDRQYWSLIDGSLSNVSGGIQFTFPTHAAMNSSTARKAITAHDEWEPIESYIHARAEKDAVSSRWDWLEKKGGGGGSLIYRLLSNYPIALPAGGYLTTTFQIAATGSPQFRFDTEAFNPQVGGGTMPASTRLCFERFGWQNPNLDQGPNGTGQDYRWFAENAWLTPLGPGTFTVTIPLTPENWHNVYGKRGDESPARATAFNAALADVLRIGFAFGGGYFDGHGVYVLSGTGTATFKLLSMSSF